MASKAPTDWAGFISEKCHTAVSELPLGTHYEDLLDCVCGMMPTNVDLPPQWQAYALHCLKKLDVDISDECKGHETTSGPAGISQFCDGSCETRTDLL